MLIGIAPAHSPSRPPMSPVAQYAMGGREGEWAGSDQTENALERVQTRSGTIGGFLVPRRVQPVPYVAIPGLPVGSVGRRSRYVWWHRGLTRRPARKAGRVVQYSASSARGGGAEPWIDHKQSKGEHRVPKRNRR